ncbi:hypothetical protein C8Q74DRAFT_1243312 [Fomes fomentarius]|nr:hypothetical protein C8Q74DRAFT_1243312 [Fomes fomentarius]
MTLPRRNFLANLPRVGWTLVSRPACLTPVLAEQLPAKDNLGNDISTVDYSHVPSNALYFSLNVTGLPSAVPSAAHCSRPRFSAPHRWSWFQAGTTSSTTLMSARWPCPGVRQPVLHGQVLDVYTAARRWDVDARGGSLIVASLKCFWTGVCRARPWRSLRSGLLTVMRLETVGMPDGVGVAVAVRALKNVWD